MPYSGDRLQILLLNKICILAEQFGQHRVVDKWVRVALAIKRDSAARKFTRAHRQRRNKTAHQAFRRVYGNTPDAKKTENVINPKRVEVTTHLLEALLPPFEAIRLHPLPVVSRKAPVLPF